VKNTSDSTIEVLDITPSCRCVSINPRSLTIAPGEVRNIEMLFDLDPKHPNEASKAVQPFETTLIAVVKDIPPQQIAWTFRGRVRKAFDLSTDSLEFGNLLTAGSPFVSRTLHVSCLLSNIVISARCDPLMGTVAVKPVDRRLGDYDIEVLPNAHLPVGEHRFFLVIEARAVAGSDLERIPACHVDVHARVYYHARAFPDCLLLGGAAVGRWLSGTVVLNSGSKRFSVKGIECSSPKTLKVECLDADSPRAASRIAYRITQMVVSPGPQQATVRFLMTDDEQISPQPVVVSVSCYGISLEPRASTVLQSRL
jgi:hypothetical protein